MQWIDLTMSGLMKQDGKLRSRKVRLVSYSREDVYIEVVLTPKSLVGSHSAALPLLKLDRIGLDWMHACMEKSNIK